MEIRPFVERLGSEVATLARIDSEDAGARAQLESAIRLALLDALTAAADEIDRDLAQGSVELRVGERDVDFVVTPPSPEPSSGTAAGRGAPDAAGDATAHISVRLPRHLLAAIEEAAGAERRSVDAWLGRLASAEVRRDHSSRTAVRRGKRRRQRLTAWVR